MIEEFIAISVDYATGFKISTILAIVFANICCFILKISYQTFLDRTLSNIYFKLFKEKHVYESLCCIFVCLKNVWNAMAVTQVIRFPLRVFMHGAWKHGILHWGYLSIKGRRTPTGKNLLSRFQGFHSSCLEQIQFVRLRNRLGSQIFLVIIIFTSQVC